MLAQNTTDGVRYDDVVATVDSYGLATQLDSSWYKAWHSWALANMEAFQCKGGKQDTECVVNALRGFFKAISLDKGSNLQDTLRLLTIAFAHGHLSRVQEELSAGVFQLPVTTWLAVVPQLIARISSPVKSLRESIQQLLVRVGTEHPQSLIYPLAVASKSVSAEKREAAITILNRLREFCATLVEQAQMVSEEMIRISILWHELWHEALEEASKAYFVDNNTEAMLQALLPMYELMEKGIETMSEISFTHQYGQLLADAFDWIRNFQHSKNEGDLNQVRFRLHPFCPLIVLCGRRGTDTTLCFGG